MYINNTKVGTPEFAQTDNDNTVWNTALMSVSLRKGANTFELKANSSGAGDLYLDNMLSKENKNSLKFDYPHFTSSILRIIVFRTVCT